MKKSENTKNEISKLYDKRNTLQIDLTKVQATDEVKLYLLLKKQIEAVSNEILTLYNEYKAQRENECERHVYIVYNVRSDEDYHNSHNVATLLCLDCDKRIDEFRIKDIKHLECDTIYIKDFNSLRNISDEYKSYKETLGRKLAILKIREQYEKN